MKSIHLFRFSTEARSRLAKDKTCEIEYNDGQMSILEIAGDERFEPLLACSIPELEAYHFTSDCNVLRYEIDADGGLNLNERTFLVGSNSLRMYLAMMELLPTFWSPTRTTLNFCIEFLLLENEIWSFIGAERYFYKFLNFINMLSYVNDLSNASLT